ncbi:MAG TPA: PhzF family phenazine biosynthesis protein [Candidatus Kryptonia bacterium]|nr:PhzF family phenazine biosynthesis protein [Candidatus Kryptonia bacterium]
MARYEYRLVDVFTNERFAGNPLAVFPSADGINATDMQRIANEFNLSETTFVLSTDHPECDCQVRIFTPHIEMPMAGHPTIGTAWVLDRGARVTFLEGVGPITVERRSTSAGAVQWWMSQPLPTWGARVEHRENAAALLGLEPSDLDADLPAEVVSTGAPFLFVALRTRDALARARLRVDQWEPLSAALKAHGVFCFTRDTGDAAVTVRSRMFAPEAGVIEDPATGSASGPLGCHLIRYGAIRAASPTRMLSLQGVEMGRPSHVHIEIEGGPDAFTAVQVGGECVAVGGGYLEI